MKNTICILTIALLVTTTACSTRGSSVYGAAPININPAQISGLPTVQYDKGTKAYSSGDELRLAMANYLLADATTPSKAAKMKREVIGLQLDQSETICSAYLTDVFGYRNTVSSSLNISSLALGAVGPLLSAGSTGPALSAAGTFFTDTNKTYLRSFYGDSDLSIVGRKIRADRRTARASIEEELAKSDSDLQKVSFGSLSSRVQEYHSMCGLNYGIESLKAAAERSVTNQESEAETE